MLVEKLGACWAGSGQAARAGADQAPRAGPDAGAGGPPNIYYCRCCPLDKLQDDVEIKSQVMVAGLAESDGHRGGQA